MCDWPCDDAKVLSKSSLGFNPAVLGRKPFKPLLNVFTVIVYFPLRATLPARCLLGEQGPVLVSGIEISDLSSVYCERQPPGTVSNVKSFFDSPAHRIRKQL